MATYGTYQSPGPVKLTFYGIILLLGFFVMAHLVRGMYQDSNPGPMNQARAEERKKTRLELNAKATEELTKGNSSPAANGTIKLPIARAMELTVEAYKNPAAAHSNLVARVQKATAPQPEQPSPFE